MRPTISRSELGQFLRLLFVAKALDRQRGNVVTNGLRPRG